jgi:D-arginine dehydrogenase
MQRCDVVVLGGGIAGVTAAAHLAEGGASVALIEAEPALAQHTTGRSAAQYLENYGGPVNVLLTLASRSSFEQGPYLSTRAMLTIGPVALAGQLEALAATGARQVPSIVVVDSATARQICPALRPAAVALGVYEPDAADIDVALLHQDYVRRLRASGGEIHRGAGRLAPLRAGGNWRVGDLAEAPVVVNATGAWADEVAMAAGVRPLGLTPLRRTAFVVPGPADSGGWPLVYDLAGPFYVKPEPGEALLCSPADETPSPPCDAREEPLDVARAIDLINAATTLDVRHVKRAWAGLRTFSPDRHPVIGFDTEAPGFFWLAGQGGTGIQTAPAQGLATAGLVLDGRLPDHLTGFGVSEAMLAPGRCRA